MIKSLILATALATGFASAASSSMAATGFRPSGTSDREGGNGMKAIAPHAPEGVAPGHVQGALQACNADKSGTSDREGGNARMSMDSNGNPNGKIKSC